ncbi:MAG: ABC transporter ATP-binding protein [Gemmatimonadetes bacterium]|nr:ABC transporter ATP-binding protein [Gemmatimonadota bacterium]
MKAPVRISGVTVSYRRVWRRTPVLHGVSLQADPGTVTAVVGPNGIGKTTLFRVLLGFLPVTEGQVSVGGLPPEGYRRRHGMAYLPEAVALPRGWTAEGLLREGARLSGLKGSAQTEALAEAWKRAGLAPGDSRRTEVLSKGIRRRLALAFALIGDPRVILLDEPLSGLDTESRTRLRRIVEEAREGGGTVIMASHDLGEVDRMADEVVHLEACPGTGAPR